MRSLKFFWPKSSLRLLVLVDEEVPLKTRDPFVGRIKKSMEKYVKSIEIKFNNIPRAVYGGRGHERQQLLLLWADNFTESKYVGFFDDDTLVSNHVLLEDIFDERGRPHVWGRSNNILDEFWKNVGATTRWTDNSDIEVMRTMNYFPVVVKTSHLKVVRSNILKHRSEFRNFDDFFQRGLIEKRRSFCQFNLMFHHLWKLKRDEYNWHLEATSPADGHFKRVTGVTNEMTVPKPRCAIHYNYDQRSNNADFIEDVFRRGFCYSLTKTEYESKGRYSRMCERAGYSWDVVSTSTNIDQWSFEYLDWRWDNRSIDAHIDRMALNRARLDWNEAELKKLFS